MNASQNTEMPKNHKLVLDKSALIDALDAPAIKFATMISDDLNQTQIKK